MLQAPGAPHDQRRLLLLAVAWPVLLLLKLALQVLQLPEPLACCKLDQAPPCLSPLNAVCAWQR